MHINCLSLLLFYKNWQLSQIVLWSSKYTHVHGSIAQIVFHVSLRSKKNCEQYFFSLLNKILFVISELVYV